MSDLEDESEDYSKYIKTAEDVAEEIRAYYAEWDRTHRIGSVEYVPEENCISINIEEGLDTYDIPFDECITAKQLTHWIWHLNEKSWMTGQIFRDFLECVECIVFTRYGVDPRVFYK